MRHVLGNPSIRGDRDADDALIDAPAVDGSRRRDGDINRHCDRNFAHNFANFRIAMFDHDHLRLRRDSLWRRFCDNRLRRRHHASTAHHCGNDPLGDSGRIELFVRGGVDRDDLAIDFNECEQNLFTEACACQLNDIANSYRLGSGGQKRDGERDDQRRDPAH